MLRSIVAAVALAAVCGLSACAGGDDGAAVGLDTVAERAQRLPTVVSMFSRPPASPASTQWPVLLSHAWSRTADTTFQGDTQVPGGEYDAYGVKTALEADGVIVYQPNKMMYGSHEDRGSLLYKRCAGDTLDARLCKGRAPVVEDGFYAAMVDYCGSAVNREKHGFTSEGECYQKVKFNIICHSQGCPDSRYMMSAITNELTGRPLYQNVASWTSLLGANKGTAQADFVIEASASCLSDQCESPLLDLAFAVDEYSGNRFLNAEGSKSVVALSTKYMTVTTDMNCDPGKQTCPPSFNQRYPLPEDLAHPIYYQTFSTSILDITHPCYQKDQFFWRIILDREGENDGNISVTSQAFEFYGPGSTGGRTPVKARYVYGDSLTTTRSHPGLNHMSLSSSDVPGLPGVSCMGEDNSDFSFSRINFYRNVVTELANLGL